MKKPIKRDPHVWESIISILAIVFFISLSIAKYEADPQVPILLGVLVASLVALRAGFSYDEIEAGMLNGITNALQAIVILCFICILIGVWIQSGVVPTMLYYGLKAMHPQHFSAGHRGDLCHSLPCNGHLVGAPPVPSALH